MRINRSRGDMYNNHYTSNPLAGHCMHECVYSKAPTVLERIDAMHRLKEEIELRKLTRQIRTQITIEPIIKFNKNRLLKFLQIANPDIIYVGANSGDVHLKEPTKEEVYGLIRELNGMFKTVISKENLERIYKEG